MSLEKIDSAQAIRLLDAGRALAVDVREPDEYAGGHIPVAPLLVYCRTGRRSEAAGLQLQAMGYTNVKNLGGILSWPYELES